MEETTLQSSVYLEDKPALDIARLCYMGGESADMCQVYNVCRGRSIAMEIPGYADINPRIFSPLSTPSLEWRKRSVLDSMLRVSPFILGATFGAGIVGSALSMLPWMQAVTIGSMGVLGITSLVFLALAVLKS